MRLLCRVAIALPLLGSAAAVGSSSKSYIVEYVSDGANPAALQKGLQAHANVDIVKTFSSDVFSGAAIEAEGHTLDTLSALPEVARVWVNKKVTLNPVSTAQVVEDYSAEAASANYTEHIATGVRKLHAMGIKGEGARIGIVDTGVQYTHPALGGGFGPGFKIVGGYDLVGDGSWPDSGEKAPDADPMDQQGHGTHVAGIIVGENEFFGGVAPQASIYSYKVFSQSDSTYEDALIDAFLMAYDDGVDIITSSIGSDGGWEDNAWAIVASRLVEQGLVITIAGGNDGDAGPFFTSTGSSGSNVIAVASLNGYMSAQPSFSTSITIDGVTTTSRIGYIPSLGYFDQSVKDWPLVVMDYNTSVTDEACNPYPVGAYNLTGKVPLIRRGTCIMSVKQKNLYALGAEWVLVYNNENPLVIMGTDYYYNYPALIENYSGEAIVKAMAAGAQVTVDFSGGPNEVMGLPRDYAGQVSEFSSWGGTYEMQMKPDIAAPGGAIFSTYIVDSYAVLSGTSMATPYIAGVAALYISAHGGRSIHGSSFGKELTRRIIASGNSVSWATGDYASDLPAPPLQVGTGLVDAFKVVNYTTVLDFEKMALNDTHHFERRWAVNVTNTGSQPVTYSFSVEPATGFDALLQVDANTTRIRADSELEPQSYLPDVSLPDSFTLKPQKSKLVHVNFEPKTWDATTLPIYSGKILVTGSNSEQQSIPYMGLGANLKTEMENMWISPPTIQTYSVPTSIWVKPYWTFNYGIGGRYDFPVLKVMLKWGTRELRWDIYESGWKERKWSYPPQVGVDGYIGSATSWVGSGSRSWSPYVTGANASDVDAFPFTEVNRNAINTAYRHTFDWFGELADGSKLPNGTYSMRVAALRPWGDPTKSSDWSVAPFPEFTVLPKA